MESLSHLSSFCRQCRALMVKSHASVRLSPNGLCVLYRAATRTKVTSGASETCMFNDADSKTLSSCHSAEGKYRSYVESFCLIIDKMKALKKWKKLDGLYVLHPDIADNISKNVTKGLDWECGSPAGTLFVEVNPGLGVLTRALLRGGIPKLRLLECNPGFLPELCKLQDENLNRIELLESDFFLFSKLSYVDKVNFSTSLERLFEGVLVSDWTQPPPLVIFATVPPKQETAFMRYLLLSFAKQSGLFSYGCIQLMLFVSGKEYEYMTNEPQKNYTQYRMASVLYKVFFNIEFLHKEHRDAFHPKPIKPTIKLLKYDPEHMYLMRLTPKPELLPKFSSPEQLFEFYYFVRQNMVRRKAFVIYTLEKWIPNCGPRLIKEGYTIFTRFGDLFPEQFLELYLNFSSWPEYSDGPFRSMVLKSGLLDENIDDDEYRDVDI